MSDLEFVKIFKISGLMGRGLRELLGEDDGFEFGQISMLGPGFGQGLV
jgi:hypothetical protein